MRRRSPRPATPLTAKQQELARAEAKLQEDMEKLQRMIADAPRRAEEESRRQREELLLRASDSRLDVSLTLQDKRYAQGMPSRPRGRALRKQRREGRILFLVLVIALAAAVFWLVQHLPF
jgi:hypothetical protein